MLGAWVPEQTFWIDVSKSCSATDPFYSIIFTLENLEFFPNSCCEKPNVYLCKGNEKVKWTCGPLPPSCGRHWNSMLKDLKDLTVGKFLWRVIETGIWGIFWNSLYGCPWWVLKLVMSMKILRWWCLVFIILPQFIAIVSEMVFMVPSYSSQSLSHPLWYCFKLSQHWKPMRPRITMEQESICQILSRVPKLPL